MVAEPLNIMNIIFHIFSRNGDDETLNNNSFESIFFQSSKHKFKTLYFHEKNVAKGENHEKLIKMKMSAV